MKKIIIILAPFVISLIVFIAVAYFLNKDSGKGALQVTSIPDSNVYLDGKLIGKTPFCMGKERCSISEMVAVGEHSIRLVPTGEKYTPYDAKITINKSTLTVVDRTFLNGASSSGSIISLVPISDKKDVQLLIISLPDKSDVVLDNNKIGFTPILRKNITESDHDLRIVKDGYFDKSLKIRTVLGYKLEALVFLGINPNFASPSGELKDKGKEEKEASMSAGVSSSKILILDTPTNFLRVRKNASKESLEISRVIPGESYDLIEEKDGWYKIELKNDELGWVSAQYAKKQ